jgi:hypothetical protein
VAETVRSVVLHKSTAERKVRRPSAAAASSGGCSSRVWRFNRRTGSAAHIAVATEGWEPGPGDRPHDTADLSVGPTDASGTSSCHCPSRVPSMPRTLPPSRRSIRQRRVGFGARLAKHFSRNVAIDDLPSLAQLASASVAARVFGRDGQPPLALCRSRLSRPALSGCRCCPPLALPLSLLERHSRLLSLSGPRRAHAPSYGSVGLRTRGATPPPRPIRRRLRTSFVGGHLRSPLRALRQTRAGLLCPAPTGHARLLSPARLRSDGTSSFLQIRRCVSCRESRLRAAFVLPGPMLGPTRPRERENPR